MATRSICQRCELPFNGKGDYCPDCTEDLEEHAVVTKAKLEEQIRSLKEHIRRGDELAAEGYDTSTLNELNRALLVDLEAQLAKMED